MRSRARSRAELVAARLLPPEPLPVRTCPHCKETSDGSDEWGGPDPCLGRLPGVLSACCGHRHHGRTFGAYVWLEDGDRLGGLPALMMLRKLGGNPLHERNGDG